jgi:hypothetical protein
VGTHAKGQSPRSTRITSRVKVKNLASMDEHPKAAWFRVQALRGIMLALGATDARIKRLHAAEAQRWLRLAELKRRPAPPENGQIDTK